MYSLAFNLHNGTTRNQYLTYNENEMIKDFTNRKSVRSITAKDNQSPTSALRLSVRLFTN